MGFHSTPHARVCCPYTRRHRTACSYISMVSLADLEKGQTTILAYCQEVSSTHIRPTTMALFVKYEASNLQQPHTERLKCALERWSPPSTGSGKSLMRGWFATAIGALPAHIGRSHRHAGTHTAAAPSVHYSAVSRGIISFSTAASAADLSAPDAPFTRAQSTCD
eukprot:Opistho-2@81006